jgi:hypothetical protein
MAGSIFRGALRGALVAGIAALAATGCGDDGGAPPAQAPARPTAAATPGAAAAAAGSKVLLEAKPHIEERVGCPIPDQPSDPKGGKCDPKVPSCPENLYCLQLAQGSFCEPCPERDGIRHAFRDRDFDPDHNRDPFESFLTQMGPRTPGPPGLTPKCPREDQLVASSYSYSDLKLVGIVAQGTQRKVLMMGGPLGYIIKRGDCVGKEKAVVKEIGLGYITFAVEPDEFSVQLNPKQLMVNEPELPTPAPRTTITPVVPPPAGRGATPPAEAPPGGAAGARPGAAAAAPAAGTAAPAGTTITPVAPAAGSAAPPAKK